MAEINAYLFFGGNCAEAMRFYERALGGKLEALLTYKDSMGEQASPQDANRIIHAYLVVDGGGLMASDENAATEYKGMSGFGVTITYKTAAEAQRAYDALSEGGKVTMPFGKTFFSDGYGQFVDKFGTPWMVNTARAS